MENINSKTDIRTYLANHNVGGYLNCEDPGAALDGLAEAVRTADGRPAYGDDWSDYLESFDYAAVLANYA